MVEIKVVLKASSEKRKRTQVFPTPESPIRSSLKSRSYVFFAIGRSGSGSRRRGPQGIGPSHYGQLLTWAFSGRSTGEAWEKRGLERARATYERPRRGSPDGGGVRCLRGRRPRLHSLSQPLRPVPGSRSGQNGLPSPLRAARPGRSHGRASKLCRRGSATDVRTVSLPSRNSAPGRGGGSKEGPRANELSYIATGSRAAPARATFSPCPLTPACALPETHARTYARPSLAPSPCGSPLRTRAGGCRGMRGRRVARRVSEPQSKAPRRRERGGAREGEAAGALPAAV